MKQLNLTQPHTLLDYLLKYLAIKAKSMDQMEFTAFFVDKIIYRNNGVLQDILDAIKVKDDLIKVYYKFKEAQI